MKPTVVRCCLAVMLCVLGISQFAWAEGGETCALARVIPSLPYCDTGSTVGHVNDYTPPCVTGVAAPDVVYTYTAPAGQTVSFSLCGSAYNTAIHVWRGCPPNGQPVCCNDNFCGLQSCCTVNLLTGVQYFIIVDGGAAGGGAAAGNYLLNVVLGDVCPSSPCVQTCPFPTRDIEPGNNACGPNLPALNCGDTLCGNITPVGDLDGYMIRIPTGTPCQTLRINVYGNDTPGWFPFGGGLDPMIQLYAADCATILGADDNSGVGNDAQFISACLEPGVYFVLVRSSTAAAPTTGPYVITLECQTCHCPQDTCNYVSRDIEPLNNSCGTPDPFVTCTDTVCGEINPSSDMDWYTLDLQGPGCRQVTIDIFGNDTPGFWPFGQGLDPRVWLYGNDCATLLGFDNDGGVGVDSRLVTGCLPPGLYHILIMSWGAAAPTMGPYVMAITCSPCLCPCDIVCPTNAIPEGEPCPNVPDNYNAGCSSNPPSYVTMNCGATFCGTSFVTAAGLRDQDWYLLPISVRDSITWCVAAEFGVRMRIFDVSGGCGALDTLFTVFADTCDTVCVADCFEPGLYAVQIVPTTIGTLNCGQYVLWTRCAPCQPNICPYGSLDVEPINNNCSPNLQPITCGDTLCGRIENPNDVDWYRVILPYTPCTQITIDIFGGDTPGWWPFGQGLDPVVSLWQNDCATMIALDDNGGVGNDSRLVSPCLPPGLYYVRVNGAGPIASVGPYILATSCVECNCPEPCQITCPTGAQFEGEPCPNIPDFYNSGCSSVPTDGFTGIECNRAVCGSSFVDAAGNVDNDWYSFRLLEPDTVWWCLQAEFDVFTALYARGPGLDPCLHMDTLDCGRAQACSTVCIGACLPPGTYAIHVRPIGGVIPCSRYVGRLNCTVCTPHGVEAPDSLVAIRSDSLAQNIELYWPPVPGADDYYIYRSTVFGTPPSPATFIGATADTSYVDVGITGTASFTNFYKIVASKRSHGCP